MKGFLIFMALFASACTKQADPQQQYGKPTTINKPMPKTFTYLALGDSYTIGEAVPQDQSFPYQLNTLFGNNTKPEIIAVTGWTTGDLKRGIEQRNLQENDYDIVTLLIGVNNQYRHYSKDEYRTEFIELLNTAISYAGGNKQHVIVLSIPDWGATPFGKSSGDPAAISADIDAFNAINKHETEKLGVAYVDITPASRRAGYETDLVASDGLHPSGKMYRLWVDEMQSAVEARLK